jgi:hypothetical protein
LHFEIDEALEIDPKIWTGLLAQLQSQDLMEKIEAGRILATMAPRSQEAVLFTFKDDLHLKQFAPMAMYKLKSERSMAALAEMLIHSEPGSFEAFESSRYLAMSGDLKWFPLLTEMARHHGGLCNYVFDAAQLGGDDAIELMSQLSRSREQNSTWVNGVSGFGYTGSRAAVPILLDLLQSGNDSVAESALYGLRKLTHVTPSGDNWNEHPQVLYQRWATWWRQNQSTAKIYKADECGEYKTLP